MNVRAYVEQITEEGTFIESKLKNVRVNERATALQILKATLNCYDHKHYIFRNAFGHQKGGRGYDKVIYQLHGNVYKVTTVYNQTEM